MPVFLVLFSSGGASAQANVPEVTQKDSSATFQSKVNLVLVPVVVRDGQGQVVRDLTREDFRVFDKGEAQTIASFSVIRRGGGDQVRGTSQTADRTDTAAGSTGAERPARTVMSPFCSTT